MYRGIALISLLLLFPLSVSAATNATAILFDVSRSVPPEDFQQAKILIRGLMEQRGPGDVMDIYLFGNEVRKISPDELDAVQPTESYTVLFDAAYDVAQALDATPAERKSLIIISDGKDTKSATILEDTASFVNQRSIAIYGIGVGDTQRKTLERIARLTGGKYIPISSPDTLQQLTAAQSVQKKVAIPEPPVAAEGPQAPEPAVLQPAQASPAAEPSPQSESGRETPGSNRLLWAGGIAAGAVLLLFAGWLLMRAFRKEEERFCRNCGRALEPYQTICPNCPAERQVEATGTPSPDSTFEMAPAEQDQELIPIELLEKRPVTEEMLSKTFVLMETPMLVIRKGRNIGQSFSLNRVYPVSIGRSRVNEIKLDDVTISGQHCRIMPESGKHVLYDLGSTNGTFVNDKRVTKILLKEGDIIKVGETQFLFKVEQQRT